jgi:hypothetical protein
MAINGIVECFAFASMNASSIFSHGKFLLVTSIAHLFTNVVLMKLIGAPGFIVANIFNMILRIYYNWSYIKRIAKSDRLNFFDMIPDSTLFILLLVSLVITGLSGLVSF